MADFRNSNIVLPPAGEGDNGLDVREHRERRLLRLVAYLILAFILALILVFGTRWFYRHVLHRHHTTTQPIKLPEPANPQPPTPPSGSSKPQSTTVPNTGPADTLAIFIGTAIVASGLHYAVKLRRA